MTQREFDAWAGRLGLARFSEEDLAALREGWLGLQPQLSLVREGLGPEDRPPWPPLGISR